LALIKLYQVDPDMKWLEAARDILIFLAKKHLAEDLVMVDHWYLISIQHIFLYQDILYLPKDLLVACAVKFAYYAIYNQRENWCNTNAIMEGYTAICLLFKYEFGMGHTYEGRYDGILEDLVPFLIEGTKRLMYCQGKTGGLGTRLDEVGTDDYRVRIDYNQHTLSTWIRTYEFLYEGHVPKY